MFVIRERLYAHPVLYKQLTDILTCDKLQVTLGCDRVTGKAVFDVSKEHVTIFMGLRSIYLEPLKMKATYSFKISVT